jgi:hypothetical protein
MTYMGDPPGTQWLKKSRKKSRAEEASDSEPSLGSWQFRLRQGRSGGDNWYVDSSPPTSSQWSAHPDFWKPLPLGEALGVIQNLRKQYGGE